MLPAKKAMAVAAIRCMFEIKGETQMPLELFGGNESQGDGWRRPRRPHKLADVQPFLAFAQNQSADDGEVRRVLAPHPIALELPRGADDPSAVGPLDLRVVVRVRTHHDGRRTETPLARRLLHSGDHAHDGGRLVGRAAGRADVVGELNEVASHFNPQVLPTVTAIVVGNRAEGVGNLLLMAAGLSRVRGCSSDAVKCRRPRNVGAKRGNGHRLLGGD